MKYHVAFYEVFTEEEALLRKYLPDGYDYLFTDKSVHETATTELPAPVISTRTQSQIPIRWADELEGIFTRSTGYDHLTAYLAKLEQPVPAGYLPTYAARAVAEQTFLLMLMLLRKIDRQRDNMKQFSRDGMTGVELQGKFLTVVGVGNIGTEIVRIGYGMDMALLGVDLTRNRKLISQFGLQYTTLETGISKADVIVCALPLTEETDRLLSYDLLASAPEHALLINVGRGEITPPQDLLRLLHDEKLAGVGIDVFDQESLLGSYLRGELDLASVGDDLRKETLNANQDLINHPRVIATPHNAFNTVESTDRKARKTAKNIENFLTNKKFLTPLPVESENH